MFYCIINFMKRILIVDDVPGWVKFHTNNINYLNIKDIEIDTAESALSALSKIEVSIDNPYNIIFTDLQMENNFLPKSAGEWLIEQIKLFPEYKNTRIVIISASSNIEQIAKKYNVLYLSKYTARNANSDIYKKFIEI